MTSEPSHEQLHPGVTLPVNTGAEQTSTAGVAVTHTWVGGALVVEEILDRATPGDASARYDPNNDHTHID